MKAMQFEFRFRVLILGVFYLLGFWAPWERYSTRSIYTAWLTLSTSVARLHWLPLNEATMAVTVLAILFAFAGALMRLWGTAYLGATIVNSGAMDGAQVVAAGPYRHVRNPLYLGSMLFSVAVAILMPPTGAIFFVVASVVFYFRLMLGEEAFLTVQQGEAYLAYKRSVPRILPSFAPRLAASEVSPRWPQSLLAEIYPLGMACCFAVLAWRYNAQILTQCLIICFGVSLVTRALLPKKPSTAAA
jgi:protein-S-isoprenylcysteine O-methyltransferase Ste14